MIDEQIHKLPTEGEPPAEEPVSGQENAAIENPAAENAAAVESTPAPREQAPVSVEAVREDGFSVGPAEPVREAAEAPVPSVEQPVEERGLPPREPQYDPAESGAASLSGENASVGAAREETPPSTSVVQPETAVPPQGARPMEGAAPYLPQPGVYGYAPPYQQPPQAPYGYAPQPPAAYPGAAPYGGTPQPNAPGFQPQQQAVQVQPAYYGYAQQPVYSPYGAEPPRPPKKKLSTGLKVFIWIASILAAAAILGLFGYLAWHAATAEKSFPYGNTPGFQMPLPQQPGDGEEDDIPDFDDGVIPPDSKEESPGEPDVDITPNTEGITIHKKPQGQELTSQEVYKKVVKSTVTVAVTLTRNGQEQNSTGTGIIATSDGYIITNSHVVLNTKSSVVKIITSGGEEYEAVVVGVDRTTDLAILKTNDHNFTPAEFGDAGELEIGDSVVAIGNPGGEKFSGSMTGGYVSGLDREVGRYSENGMTYIQTDAAINPGNSGGPLVNMYGQVIGINSSKIITDGYEGMGFAIPVSKAQSIINELLSGGYVKGRTRLGITGMEVSDAMVALYQMPQGFMISEIGEESAFTGTEAREGDIITAIDGETVTSLSDISNLLLKYAPGDTAEITLYRQNGTELKVTVTLLEDKGETQK